MKKAFLIAAFVVALLSVIATIKVAKDGNSSAKSAKISVISSENRPTLYVVKEDNGKVAVFNADETKPLYYLENVVFKSLPQYDQRLLKTGIKVKSEKELRSVIEDYDS